MSCSMLNRSLHSRVAIFRQLNFLGLNRGAEQQRSLHSLGRFSSFQSPNRHVLLISSKVDSDFLQQRRDLVEWAVAPAAAAVVVKVVMLPLALWPARIDAKRWMMKDDVAQKVKNVLEVKYRNKILECDRKLKASPHHVDILKAMHLINTGVRKYKQPDKDPMKNLSEITKASMEVFADFCTELEFALHGYTRLHYWRAKRFCSMAQFGTWLWAVYEFKTSAIAPANPQVFLQNGDVNMALLHVQEVLSAFGMPVAIAVVFAIQSFLAFTTSSYWPSFRVFLLSNYLHHDFSRGDMRLISIALATVCGSFGVGLGCFAYMLPQACQMYILSSGLLSLGMLRLVTWPSFYTRFWKLSKKERDGVINIDKVEITFPEGTGTRPFFEVKFPESSIRF